MSLKLATRLYAFLIYCFRSFFQEYLDKAKSYRQAEAYQKAMRKRGVWVEPLFAEAKQFHRLRCFRLRGLVKVNIEGVMTAAGQNLRGGSNSSKLRRKNQLLDDPQPVGNCPAAKRLRKLPETIPADYSTLL
ncbi:MAG TPA: transposase [Anaerolineales bacterium]|jgi:hypothetical protein|nr:transposase [Anaerolineales bacterium]